MKKIPIISSDLRLEETNVQAVQIFEYLDNVIDEVFDKIDARIQHNNERMKTINERIVKAELKIESFKSSKKAIRIYSPAKYPIAGPPKFHPTFPSSNETKLSLQKHRLDHVPFDPVDYKQYSDKLQFFHLKRPRKTQQDKPNLIYNTKSINSLISFANNENILHQEPPVRTTRSTKEQTVDVIADDDTDFSRFSTLMKNKQDMDNFYYLPHMNTAPEVELPIDLPDLPGIAGDISFTISDQELIAPSLARMNIINELPNITDMIEADTSRKPVEVVSAPIVPISVPEKKLEVKTFEPPSIPSNIPPPPPPIPSAFIPPPPPPMSVEMTTAKKASQPVKLPPADTARSSLLAAIRDAGGKSKLRSVAAAEEPSVNQKKKVQATAPPAGDLMSDLHQKLIMRRRAISGNKESKKDKSSIMQKVSSLIPPPPKRTESDSESSSNNNESDWD